MLNFTNDNGLNNRIKLLMDNLENAVSRRRLVHDSFLLFFCAYFHHYMRCALAAFHLELIGHLENGALRQLVAVMFRGSAKSTIITTAYPIWAIMGSQRKKNILLVSQTQDQAHNHLKNIRRELEQNALLQNDLGPFQDNGSPWGVGGLYIRQYDATIYCASADQSIRGLRQGAYRPDVIIFDDIENLNSTSTIEARQKTFEQVTSEFKPAGSDDCRFIFAGNFVHPESLLMNMRTAMEKDPSLGVSMFVPLVDEQGRCSWPARFPDSQAVETLRQNLMNDTAWQREFLLKHVDNNDRLVKSADIHYYDDTPWITDPKSTRLVVASIDPALTLNQSSDYTAIITGIAHGHGKDFHLYILPDVIIKRLRVDEIYDLSESIARKQIAGQRTRILVEGVLFQTVLCQEMKKRHLNAESVPIKGDKRERLMQNLHRIYDGTVLFPRQGAEKLIEQLVNFPDGVIHDDGVDSLTLQINYVMKKFGSSAPGMAVGNLHRITPVTPPGLLANPYGSTAERQRELEEYYRMAQIHDDLQKEAEKKLCDLGLLF